MAEVTIATSVKTIAATKVRLSAATNPFTADALKPYDQQRQYRDRLSVSPYPLDSTSNPYGRYGSQYGNALSNPFGSGSPYSDGPKNP